MREETAGRMVAVGNWSHLVTIDGSLRCSNLNSVYTKNFNFFLLLQLISNTYDQIQDQCANAFANIRTDVVAELH